MLSWYPNSTLHFHASHAALPTVTLKISPCTNVTLTFDFDLGLDHPVHGRYGWGGPTPRKRNNCQTKKLKSGYGPHWGSGTKTNWPTDRRSQCNLKLKLRHCTANYRPVFSSERAPYVKKKESNCHSNKCNIWSPSQKGARHQDWPSVIMWLRLRQRHEGVCGEWRDITSRIECWDSNIANLETRKYFVGFEILTAVVMKGSISWNITPYSPLKVDQRFGGTCRLYL
jgi:hypothetical protein